MKKQNKGFFLENGEAFDVPEEGSLGLLAMGARGIIAWRKKRGILKKMKKETKKMRNSINE
jgi:hypothetical protein